MNRRRKYEGVCPEHYPGRRHECGHCCSYQSRTGETLPLIRKQRVFVEPPLVIRGAPPSPVFPGLHWPAPSA